MLDDLAHRALRFFWETTNAANGLAPDCWPAKSACSIAALGFALTAYPVGVERGWISRAQARDRVLTTLRFLRDAPQGPEPMGRSGYRGFFYHFLDMTTGTRAAEDVELSSVDTALLIAGVLYCQCWFDGTDAAEVEIRALAGELYARVDWRWMQTRPPSICHGWYPDSGFMEYDWKGYNEAMILYVLALGSPTFAVEPDAWEVWTSTYDRCWTTTPGEEHLHFASLFGHQFSHCWIDFKGIADAYLRQRGLDYFENSRRATYAQRAYASANPLGWNGYGPDVWGISASQGPADIVRPFAGETRRFRSYAGRGAGVLAGDDGTIAPHAVAASLPFAPEIVTPTLRALLARFGPRIYSQYGFIDAFNLSFDYDDVPLVHGQRIAGWGWVDTNYLGIDQGPTLAMLGNHGNESVWRPMRNNPHLRRGLVRAGFTGGWLA
ncbi:MAG TPA: glucoamylase family protein [Burkholderiaceae bacterium]|nr:glucoamylase family protein [Burkholderiaceae bacterium]